MMGGWVEGQHPADTPQRTESLMHTGMFGNASKHDCMQKLVSSFHNEKQVIVSVLDANKLDDVGMTKLNIS